MSIKPIMIEEKQHKVRNCISNMNRYSPRAPPKETKNNESALKTFHFFTFKDGKTEIVEIPRWDDDTKNRLKQQDNTYTTENHQIGRMRQLNDMHSRKHIRNDNREKSEIISRNSNNLQVSSSMKSKYNHKHDAIPKSVLIDKPIRTLRQIFKQIKA